MAITAISFAYDDSFLLLEELCFYFSIFSFLKKKFIFSNGYVGSFIAGSATM